MEGTPSLESSRLALAQLERRLGVFLDTAEIIKEKISEIRANCASASSLAKCSSASKELQSFLCDIQTDRDQLEGRFRNFQKSLDEDVSQASSLTKPRQVPPPSTASSPSKRTPSVEASALDREAKRQRQVEEEDVKAPVPMTKEEPTTAVKEEKPIILSAVKQEYVELLSEDEDPGLPSLLPPILLRPILQEESPSPSPTFDSPPSSDKACTHSVQPTEASLASQLHQRWEAPPADAITQTNIGEKRAPSRGELLDTRAYLHSSRSGLVAHDEAEYDKYLSLADREKKFLERRRKCRKEDVGDCEGSACFGRHSRDITVPHSLGRTREQLNIRINRDNYRLANFGFQGDFRCKLDVLRQIIVDYDFVLSRHEEQTIYVVEIQQNPRAFEVRREILQQLAGASQAIAIFYNSDSVSRSTRRDNKCKDECLHYVGHFKIKQDTLEAFETDYKAPDSRFHPQTGRKIYARVRAEFAYYHEALANAIDNIRE